MKVVKKTDKKYRTLTLRIDENIMRQVDKLAEKSGVSRQKLVEAILEKVMNDKKFIVEV